MEQSWSKVTAYTCTDGAKLLHIRSSYFHSVYVPCHMTHRLCLNASALLHLAGGSDVQRVHVHTFGSRHQ